MKTEYILLGIAVMALTTYLIRMLPMAIFRKKITNVRIRSFLYYVPYAVLATLAFPDILYCAENPASGAVAAVMCAVLAYRGKGLITCMFGSVISVLAVESLLLLF